MIVYVFDCLQYKQKSFHTTAEAERLHADIIEKRKTNKKNSDKEVIKVGRYSTCLSSEFGSKDFPVFLPSILDKGSTVADQINCVSYA